MNKTNLKRYAPQARKDFIAAVTARAQLLGLNEVGGTPQAEPCTVNGEVAVIAGRPWPASVQGKRERLFQRMKRDGFSATLEAVAYTWFNRFAALRYMELHDYLGHGRRVVSNPEGGLPEALAYALDLAEAGDLPGLRPDAVRQFKLDNQDSELFRRVLVAQCNALHGAMPFLFERIDDDSELLLPDNLLRSDSVIAKLVDEIPEEDWAEVEIIGWLYQFYISEKKDQVIGKVVNSEDIPAATQLFTPNWIVQYLVQNSVGRLWLMANPLSTLAQEWPYYITPAEQTPEVQAQLDALIQTRVREDGDAINPESITVLDPACGSGHILVVAYDVLKAIYLERGYQPRAIPRLILEKNLYGLDIDDRAAQMAGFALLMKARADDRRLFTATDEAGKLQPPKLNVLSLRESKGLSVDELATQLAPFKVQRATITALVDAFEHAKTFGSLIQIPYALKTHLGVLPEVLALVKQSADMYATAAADDLLPLVQQAQVLAMQFDAVVANPPYMGGKYFNPLLKEFIKSKFTGFDKDLYPAFFVRNLNATKPTGFSSCVVPFGWMSIGTFENLRNHILDEAAITSLVKPSYTAFFDSAIVSLVAITLLRKSISVSGTFFDLGYLGSAESQPLKFLEGNKASNCDYRYIATASDFKKIPGHPIAYWASKRVREIFSIATPLSSIADPRLGMATGRNETYVRQWSEVSLEKVNLNCTDRKLAVASKKKWFPYNKGGEFRKWYGNKDYLVDWENDGEKLQTTKHSSGRVWAHNFNLDYIFKPSLTWSFISSSYFGVRVCEEGALFDVAGSSAFPSNENMLPIAGFLCTKLAFNLMRILNPTVNVQAGDVGNLPYLKVEIDSRKSEIEAVVKRAIDISSSDWNSYETAWGFQALPWVANHPISDIQQAWGRWESSSISAVSELKALEEKNNLLFIEAYGLKGEISPEVPADQITLARADREKDCQRLISYAIGCMMGRYSLDEPGLIYAHAGSVGFEPGRYASFPADADGIVPITDELWFADDACSRIREFLRAVWGQGTLAENMAWLAESLGTKASESPDETIRRYLADKFFKDHLQTYKKRPIYWLFSSGKQGAFQALVYLHRYHEGTLARMRAEYVVPLTSKIQSRIEMLQKDALAAASTAARNKLAKDVEKLKKKHVELLAYDEQLRHYADMRITLDLDDGVKVNYGKFGDLLEGVKVVTGGAGDD